jgi:hypothetical protein
MRTKTRMIGKKILILSWELSLLTVVTITAIYILSIAFGIAES